MKSTVVDESLSSYKPMYCSRDYQASPAINFTVEGNQENGAIPFLDTLVNTEADKFPVNFFVQRNPPILTNTNNWDSHHNLAAKYSVNGTLTHRVKQFVLGESF